MKGMNRYAVGADIGGTHVEAAVFDLTSYEEIKGTRVCKKVDHTVEKDVLLGTWAEVINGAVGLAIENNNIHKEDILGVGIAIPGPFDCKRGISLMDHKFESLYTISVRNELALRTDFRANTIRFKNDAESFLLGEVLRNGGIDSAVGITLGTGFGSAYYKDGESKDANLWCAPYRDNIIEDYTATRWFVGRYKELSGQKIVGAKDLVDMIGSDSDAHAKQIFGEYGATLCDFLLPLVMEKKVDALILGGSISRSHGLFTDALRTKLPAGIRLIASDETETSAMAGAASLLVEEREKK